MAGFTGVVIRYSLFEVGGHADVTLVRKALTLQQIDVMHLAALLRQGFGEHPAHASLRKSLFHVGDVTSLTYRFTLRLFPLWNQKVDGNVNLEDSSPSSGFSHERFCERIFFS